MIPGALFHFPSSRTHGGGLLGLGVNADERHSADSPAVDGNYVAASAQVGLHRFGEGVGHGEAAQAGSVLTEGADEMLGGEARRLKRLLGTHAELNVVQDDLDYCLILLVAARYRDRHHGLVVLVTEKQRGTQRDSRPLAGLDDVGSSRKCVQTAEPASVDN